MSIKIANDQNFKELIKEGFSIVDFYTTTCVPCKMFARILEDIAIDFPFINIVKVNLTDYPIIGQEYNVEAVPTVLFVSDGEIKNIEVGLMEEEEVISKISEYYYG